MIIFLCLVLWLLVGLFNCYMIGRSEDGPEIAPLCIVSVLFAPLALIVILGWVAHSLGARHR